jgi:hypothetical protein
MTPVEMLTLAPLAALVVILGLLPGIVLDLIRGSVATSLADVGTGQAIAIDPAAVAIGLGIIVAVIVIRLITLRPRGPAAETSAVPEPVA